VIGSTRQVSVFALGAPADLRKGFDGLTSLVSRELQHEPLSAALYLFVNRMRQGAKVLLWDGTGLCIYAKRLERGRFAALWRDDACSALRLELTPDDPRSQMKPRLVMEESLMGNRVSMEWPDRTIRLGGSWIAPLIANKLLSFGLGVLGVAFLETWRRRR
jgi:transposase